MMIAIGLLLVLLQDPSVSTQANKLVSGLRSLQADPIKNADELDRRFLALKKILDAHPEFKSRHAALGWMSDLALKTGRPKDALAVTREILESPSLSPQEVRRWAVRALYVAFLTAKPGEVSSLVRAVAKKYPDSILAKRQDDYVKAAKILGRRGATVSLPTLDGRRFSWRSRTKDKIVLLYFCASW